METAINIALPIALVAVLIVLTLGVLTLVRGGPGAKSRSNQLMRWRVGLQFIAVLVLAAGFYIKSQSGG